MKKQQTLSAVSSPDRETADFVCCFLEVSIKDASLLHKIQAFLKVGVISTRKRDGFEFARYKITSKKDLINVILPIFDSFGMLTSKQYDYLHMKKQQTKSAVSTKP